jgi:hypothetical protein
MKVRPIQGIPGLPRGPLKTVINKELRDLVEREVNKGIQLGEPGPVYAEPEVDNGSFRASIMSEFENLIGTLEMLATQSQNIASQLGCRHGLPKRENLPDVKQLGGFFPELTDAMMRAAQASSEVHGFLSMIEREVSPDLRKKVKDVR